MKSKPTLHTARMHMLRVLLLTSCLLIGLVAQPALAQDTEPIAYVGHGAFFDAEGNELTVTQEFVARAQRWYRAQFSSGLDTRKKREFGALENRLEQATRAEGQARLVVQQHALAWLFANSPRHVNDDRTLGKMRALEFALKRRLAERVGQPTSGVGEDFVLEPRLVDAIRSLNLTSFGDSQVLRATTNLGQAYLNECMAARVPIPPTINVMDPAGVAGWKSQGFIAGSEQFIVGSPAEVRTFSTADGMCMALPRFNASQTTVNLDGVICLSKITSKVCFWDNQMMGSGFSFPAGTQIPIGVANTAIDPSGRYQAGGFELLGGSGGVCTDCHAGENPYIIHPRSNLGGGLLWGTLQDPPQSLPTFAPNRYDPLVAAAWPQNQLSQAGPTLPAVCDGCHFKGSAGRFPHLSNQLPGYCNTILPQAIARTMPPGSPGSASAAATTFKNEWCNDPPNSSAADSGDPHITTTNGIHYDFQAAGEFTILRNSDTGFVLQARQSPVLTSFTPVANDYTDLASCVSLNTAVAMRIGKHRVTYQPARGGFASAERLQLRVDGMGVNPVNGVNLGGNNVIAKAGAGGEIDVSLADGTRVVITPIFWSSQQLWYLEIQVFHTPSREGVMGPILASDWLPRAPDGSSFGPKPGLALDRHVLLNQKFADAWRVATTTSLFDYAAGVSTADFTDRNWPSEPGKSCTSTTVRGPHPLVREPRPDLAKKACRGIKDKAIMANCIFDVTVMGDVVAAKGHQRADKLKAAVMNTWDWAESLTGVNAFVTTAVVQARSMLAPLR